MDDKTELARVEPDKTSFVIEMRNKAFNYLKPTAVTVMIRLSTANSFAELFDWIILMQF